MNVTKEKLEQIFKVYEDKKNSTPGIKTSEIAKLIRSARMFPSQQDIVNLQKQIDPSKQGYFNMSKFVQVGLAFAEKQANIDHQQQLMRAFSFFDQEENGFITQADLKKIMNAFGQPLNDQEARQILKYAKTSNGRIYYKDFVKTIISGKLE